MKTAHSLRSSTGVHGPALLVAMVLATAGCFSLPEVEPAANPNEHVVGHPEGACRLCDVYYAVSPQIVRVITPTGQGAGIVVTRAGAILTNAHVVGDSDVLAVEAGNDQRFRVNVAHRDANRDLALLRPDAGTIDVDPMPLSAGGLAPIGTGVYVIGHPAGLGWTVTRGTISGHRKAGKVVSVPLLQTDATISPGNSGGPLLDEDGHLLGLVTDKVSAPGKENVAFAIPVGVLENYLDRRGKRRSAIPKP
jgi:S1-C subfamily serine protease